MVLVFKNFPAVSCILSFSILLSSFLPYLPSSFPSLLSLSFLFFFFPQLPFFLLFFFFYYSCLEFSKSTRVQSQILCQVRPGDYYDHSVLCSFQFFLDLYPDQLQFFSALLFSLSCFKTTTGIHSGGQTLLGNRNICFISFCQVFTKIHPCNFITKFCERYFRTCILNRGSASPKGF